MLYLYSKSDIWTNIISVKVGQQNVGWSKNIIISNKYLSFLSVFLFLLLLHSCSAIAEINEIIIWEKNLCRHCWYTQLSLFVVLSPFHLFSRTSNEDSQRENIICMKSKKNKEKEKKSEREKREHIKENDVLTKSCILYRANSTEAVSIPLQVGTNILQKRKSRATIPHWTKCTKEISNKQQIQWLVQRICLKIRTINKKRWKQHR